MKNKGEADDSILGSVSSRYIPMLLHLLKQSIGRDYPDFHRRFCRNIAMFAVVGLGSSRKHVYWSIGLVVARGSQEAINPGIIKRHVHAAANHLRVVHLHHLFQQLFGGRKCNAADDGFDF
jgi:hypothetical protein